MRHLLLICGFPSGGTDLTKTILNAHRQIYINGEMPFLPEIERFGYERSSRFRTRAELDLLRERLRNLDPWGNIENIRHTFAIDTMPAEGYSLEDVLYVLFSDREREIWGNKTPQNTEHIETLFRLFPQACFLIVTRDVRDICLSWQNKWGKDMLLCASKWAQRISHAYEFASQLPSSQSLKIRFEDLISDTEALCRQMCEFLDIPFDGAMLEHHKYVERPIDGKINYGRPVQPQNQYKWLAELPATTVRRIEEIAWNTMALTGYAPAYATGHRPISKSEELLGRSRDALALFFVGNRASGQNDFRHRLNTVRFELQKRSLRT